MNPGEEARERAYLQSVFPSLPDSFAITSEPAPYNCIAWAVEDSTAWWWPTAPRAPPYYWPVEAPRENTVEAFTVAFGTLGYEPCGDEDLEEGYQKIALFALDGKPTHAARQRPDGAWTSKCGERADIRHETLEELRGNAYGEAVRIFKRSENWV